MLKTQRFSFTIIQNLSKKLPDVKHNWKGRFWLVHNVVRLDDLTPVQRRRMSQFSYYHVISWQVLWRALLVAMQVRPSSHGQRSYISGLLLFICRNSFLQTWKKRTNSITIKSIACKIVEKIGALLIKNLLGLCLITMHVKSLISLNSLLKT